MNHTDNPFLSQGWPQRPSIRLDLKLRAATVRGYLKGAASCSTASVNRRVQLWARPPAIADSFHAQLDLSLHTMVYGEFIQDVHGGGGQPADSLPSHLDSVYFVNSGAEAVDAALKLAKRLTGRTKLMGVEGGYHETPGALSVSSNETRGPRSAPCCLKCPSSSGTTWRIGHIDANTAAVIVETVQGTPAFASSQRLQALANTCRANGAMFILDEMRPAAWEGLAPPGPSASLTWFPTSCAWAKRGRGARGRAATCTRMSQLALPSLGTSHIRWSPLGLCRRSGGLRSPRKST